MKTPERWTSPASHSPREERAGALLRGYARATSERADQLGSQPPARPLRPRPRWKTWTVRAGATAFVAGLLVFAVLRAFNEKGGTPPPSPVAPVPEQAPAVVPVATGEPAREAEEATEPSPREHVAAPARRDATRPAPAPLPAKAPAEPDPLSEEARLLQEAMRALRTEQRPGKTRTLLGRYYSRFPNGQLRSEALQLELEAALAQGDEEDVSHRLDALSLENHPRARALRLLHAQLLIEKDRCDAASPMLQPLLSDADESVSEPAHWSQVICASRGDAGELRSALDTYLARFPEGPHAAEARARFSEQD